MGEDLEFSESGEVAEPQEGEQGDVSEAEAGGETGTAEQETPGETEGADQSRTSKQSPETDAAFARMRREADDARRQLSERDMWVRQQFGQYGIQNWEQYQQAVQQQEMERQAQALAEENAITPEMAQRLLAQEQRQQRLEQQLAIREAESRNLQAKAELRGARFFKELEPDVDRIIADHPQLDLKTVFNALRGERVDALLQAEGERIRKETERKTLESLKANRQGKVVSGAAVKAPVGKGQQQHATIRDALTAAAAEIDW